MTSEPPYLDWPGESGAMYRYYIFAFGHAFAEAQPGNYIFTKLDGLIHRPIYIGETGDGLQERLSPHERLPCILWNGATHVMAHVNEDKWAREYEETDLRRQWPTPCNRQ